jgi:flagellar FliL protein
MSEGASEAKAAPAKGGKGGKGRLLLLGLILLLVLGGGGVAAAFFLHLGPFAQQAAQDENRPPPPPVFVEVPDIVANLNAPARRQAFVRLKARLEVARPEDAAAAQAAMPRLLDLFTTYLRETRPEELRGSAGTQRLREELIARANIVLRPVNVSDVLFVEIVVQ